MLETRKIAIKKNHLRATMKFSCQHKIENFHSKI